MRRPKIILAKNTPADQQAGLDGYFGGENTSDKRQQGK
jgi:hypothetical protein